MEGKITVVGTGPGHPDFLTPAGAAAIADATVVLGGRRLLESFAHAHQQQFVVDKDLKGAVEFIEQNYRQHKLTVLVSGDTGIYSLASYLARWFSPETLNFIPGVSSVQLMFARLKKPWQKASIISLHGRPPQGLAQLIKGGNMVAVLTDNRYTPCEVASYLLQKGCPDCHVAVGTNLSYDNEKVITSSLRTLASAGNDPTPAVVVIDNE